MSASLIEQDETIIPNLEKIDESLKIAEQLAKLALMTSSAVKRRIAARSLEIGQMEGNEDDEDEMKCFDYIPPKEVLIYLVRMGSFKMTPKIMNDDCQDNDLQFPAKLTNAELLTKCKNELATLPPLLNRNLEYKEPSVQNTNIVSTFRVLQWNVLAQSLGVSNDNFVSCSNEALNWNTRRYRILEEILTYDPDIICLQEVDHFNFLKKTLETINYDGVFFPKPDSPCLYINDNNGPDGCAIFYKTKKFDLIKTEQRILEVWRVQSNQVALLVLLKDCEAHQEICVCTTHLKAKNGALLSTLRKEQGLDLLKFIETNFGGRPIVLCGDFNAEPTEPIYYTILDNPYLKNLASSYANLKPGCEKNIETSHEREPKYTTWKIREEGEICHTIDYIFYSYDNIDVKSCLKFPTDTEIGPGRIPSWQYPSDHFSLVCDFNLTKPIR